MPDNDPASESAKAIQEVAKATGKAIDASQRMGGFVAKYVASSIEQGMGIVEDKLRYIRWERQLRLIARAEQFMREQGINEPARRLPMKIGVPLLQGAAMEDDDSLQDMWARLLVNAVDEKSGVSLQRAYVEILSQLSPLEARILQTIYAFSLPVLSMAKDNGILTAGLPDKASVGPEVRTDLNQQPPDEICLALANLARIGCLRLGQTFGGGEVFSLVHPTLMGRRFVEACTLWPRTSVRAS